MTDINKEYLSRERYDELSAELTNLKKNLIPAIATRIDEARQMGDLSENAEYHAARDEMAWARTREKELNAILENAEIITDQQGSSTVDIGSTITVEVNGTERTYTIVGAQEVDPAAGKISNESPLGQAFIGKRVGEKAEVRVPAGLQVYRIIAIL